MKRDHVYQLTRRPTSHGNDAKDSSCNWSSTNPHDRRKLLQKKRSPIIQLVTAATAPNEEVKEVSSEPQDGPLHQEAAAANEERHAATIDVDEIAELIERRKATDKKDKAQLSVSKKIKE